MQLAPQSMMGHNAAACLAEIGGRKRFHFPSRPFSTLPMNNRGGERSLPARMWVDLFNGSQFRVLQGCHYRGVNVVRYRHAIVLETSQQKRISVGKFISSSCYQREARP